MEHFGDEAHSCEEDVGNMMDSLRRGKVKRPTGRSSASYIPRLGHAQWNSLGVHHLRNLRIELQGRLRCAK